MISCGNCNEFINNCHCIWSVIRKLQNQVAKLEKYTHERVMNEKPLHQYQNEIKVKIDEISFNRMQEQCKRLATENQEIKLELNDKNKMINSLMFENISLKNAPFFVGSQNDLIGQLNRDVGLLRDQLKEREADLKASHEAFKKAQEDKDHMTLLAENNRQDANALRFKNSELEGELYRTKQVVQILQNRLSRIYSGKMKLAPFAGCCEKSTF